MSMEGIRVCIPNQQREMCSVSSPDAYTETRDKIFSQLVPQYVPHVALLLDHPLVRLQQYRVRQRHEVRREHLDDVADARDGDPRRVVDRLSSPSTPSASVSAPSEGRALTSFLFEYTASASNPSSPSCSLALTCLLTQM